MNKSSLTLAMSSIQKSLLVAAVSLLPVFSNSNASTWSGPSSGNWNVSGNWSGGIPNAIGAVANGIPSNSTTIAQDIVGGVTVGTISVSGAANAALQFTLTNGITLNQDGASAGNATISNSASGTASQIYLPGAASSVTLADNLLVTNTGSSTKTAATGGALRLSAIFTGSGNVTFTNVSNNYDSGAIVIGADNTYTGSVTVEKGAVYWGSVSTPFGASANSVTLGSAGQGAASMINNGNSTLTFANNITIASGTSGTLLLGSINSGTSNYTYSGSIALNGDLSVTSAKTGAAAVRYTGAISGAGGLTILGTGATQFGDGTTTVTNTYHGNTILSGTSKLTLGDNDQLTFYIGANGVNNKISGSGQTLTLNGDFVFDLTGAASVGSWTIVDVANLTATFSSFFTVAGFTDAGSNMWTHVNGSTTYTFSEATGVLTAVPEPSVSLLVALGSVLVLWRTRRARSNRAA